MLRKTFSLKRYIMVAVILCVILVGFFATDKEAVYAETFSWEEEVVTRVRDAFMEGGTRVELSDLYIPEAQHPEVQKVLDASLECCFMYAYARSSDGYVKSVSWSYHTDYLNADRNVDLKMLHRDYAELCRAVDNIMLAVDEDMSDIEKVLYVHDWLVEQTDYAYEEYLAGTTRPVHGSARGPLLEHKSVCSGYARAFALLTGRMGVNVCIVSSGEMNHSWNMVELDGVWYHVDATWDDPVYNDYGGDYWNEGGVRHTYFLISDEEIAELSHHDWSEDAPKASVSNAFSEEFFYKEPLPFGYKDGKWYYYLKNQIVQRDYVGDDIEAYRHKSYMIVNGVLVDDIYFFAEQKTLYGLPIEGIPNGTLNEVCTVDGYIEEFAVKDGIAIIVYWDSEASEYVTERFSLAAYLNISSYEVSYESDYIEVGDSIDTEKINVLAETESGYRFSVLKEECNFSSVDTSTPGVKQLKVKYNGNQFQTPIRVAYSLTAEYELDVSEYVYTGAPIQPVPTVYFEGKKLQQGQDFCLSYSNNCKVGTATITVEGKGNYNGSFTIPFEITKKAIATEKVKVLFPKMDMSDDDTFWTNVYENIVIRVEGITIPEDEYRLGTVWWSLNKDGVKHLSRVSVYLDDYSCLEDDSFICEVELMPLGWKETYKFVDRLYTIVLERTPDVSGIDSWVNSLTTGNMTGVRVADGFIMSDEFMNKDISNEEFVKILYRAFFGREADADGLATWKGLLDAGCKKTYVFAGFANSTEFGNLCAEAGIVQGRAAEYLADRQTGLSEADYKVWCFVERMYMEVLNRTADEPGVRRWVGALQDGSMTGVQVADGFIMSDEFLAKNMTNEEYVRIMYRAFFGRDADAEGLATWTNALATGWTKQDVFAGFANSNEFGVLCGQAGIVQGTAEEK